MPVKKESRVKNQESSKKTAKAAVISSAARNLKIKSTRPSSGSRDSSTSPQNDRKITAKENRGRKTAFSKRSSLSVPAYSLSGRSLGTMSLPKEIFGAQVNKALLTQAMRVYLTNQQAHHSSTKTRAEVTASSRKIWRQKGTGRARHGAVSAPIFVGGGVALGPKARKVILDLPKKMKKKALVSALAQKMIDQEVLGVSGLEKATGKTKQMAEFLKQLNLKFKEQNSKLKTTLIVTGQKMDKAIRAASNISGVDILPVDQINALEVIRHHNLIFTKEAVERLKQII